MKPKEPGVFLDVDTETFVPRTISCYTRSGVSGVLVTAAALREAQAVIRAYVSWSDFYERFKDGDLDETGWMLAQRHFMLSSAHLLVVEVENE